MKIYISFFLVLIFFSCTRPEKEPEFRGVNNIRVKSVQGTTAILNADALFYNPNDIKVVIKSIDVNVLMDNKTIGKINQSVKTKVPAKSDFKVPLDATFNLKDEGTLSNIIGMIGGKKREVQYKGYIKVTVHGWPVRVPVDYKDEVRIKF